MNLKPMRPSTRKDHAGVVAPPPAIFGTGFAVGLALERVVPLPEVPLAVRLLGSIPIALGTALLVWFFATLRRAGTPVDPYRTTVRLVTWGPYRFSRNPAYLGMGLIVLGAALSSGVLWANILLPAVLVIVHLGVIKREERYLAKRFGSQYSAYKARTRRWL